jgi:hypothetical protein
MLRIWSLEQKYTEVWLDAYKDNGYVLSLDVDETNSICLEKEELRGLYIILRQEFDPTIGKESFWKGIKNGLIPCLFILVPLGILAILDALGWI